MIFWLVLLRLKTIFPGSRCSLFTVGPVWCYLFAAARAYLHALTHPLGCLSAFESNKISTIAKNAIIRGWCNHSNGLWCVPLQTCPPLTSEYILLPKDVNEAVSNVYELPRTSQIVRFLHAYMVFPTKSTWLNAICKGSYGTWAHLTLEAAAKHFPESNKKQQGHMHGIRQGIRSTTQKTRARNNQTE